MKQGILIWAGIVLGISFGVVVLLWSIGGRALYGPTAIVAQWSPATRQAAAAFGFLFWGMLAMVFVFGAIARRTWEDFYCYGRNVWDNSVRNARAETRAEQTKREYSDQQNVELAARVERLEQDVKALETERNAAQKSLKNALEQLVTERKAFNESIATLTRRLETRDETIHDQHTLIATLETELEKRDATA